jgi:hypothetical protein
VIQTLKAFKNDGADEVPSQPGRDFDLAAEVRRRPLAKGVSIDN